jgi:hypothetical protein
MGVKKYTVNSYEHIRRIEPERIPSVLRNINLKGCDTLEDQEHVGKTASETVRPSVACHLSSLSSSSSLFNDAIRDQTL